MREGLAQVLLDWYDDNARVMPWRVGPADRARGQRPDPYRIWLSEIMLQQTTVAAVRDYFVRFTNRWPRVEDLAAAEDAEVMGAWAGLGYYARARNLLRCARVVAEELDGRFPDTEAELLKLPGIGPYTAAAVAAIAFDRPAAVVDGNVERVMSRLRLIETPLPDAKPAIRQAAETLTPIERPGDYAQAVMDLGATICTPRNPSCMLCPWRSPCAAREAGVAETLPRKAPKKAKPVRRGYLYLAQRGDDWLLEQRPDKGLLGGMLAFPTSDWGEAPTPAPPALADWRDAGEVRHTFTHFHLILRVMQADAPGPPSRGAFAPLDPKTLPTVFRKAHKLVTQGRTGRD
ncbi:A/G-specific adenine glycosylase [Jannaschia pagri]|uniref:Adenine DNA glycosylase n=1 Tax=Jannaschia pagri TaxID=2829797 RepID=A0ABQ4NPW6_9RHOB|nr:MULTISPECIES: A/G-specific adenine glycosylase [unclassified Jannaschia]GIT92686.1 A/G-specific adenine glycosylase [Jannaschia sp. AI_61]GIT96454.1 A/G-specific adenine glycosylase [Jannaschia sp. AI_62]